MFYILSFKISSSLKLPSILNNKPVVINNSNALKSFINKKLQFFETSLLFKERELKITIDFITGYF